MACDKCQNGWIITPPLGLKVKCSCIIESPIKEDNSILEKPVYHVTGAQKELAVQRRLIPEARMNDEFDEQFVKNRVVDMCRSQDCQIKNFQKYIDTLNEIILSISFGNMNKSYIIGAPNGFGKTTFANTCIKRLSAMDKKVAPFISLFELADLRVEHEKKLLGWATSSKKPEKVEDGEEQPIEYEYTWKDYMQSDVLFTYLTTLENKKVEVLTLKAIIDIRGPKGLNTVVFTDSSMNPYLNDCNLKKIVWDDILAYSDDAASCDRLLHRSCFKIYNNTIKAKAGEDY